jgi:hypothetical protein
MLFWLICAGFFLFRRSSSHVHTAMHALDGSRNPPFSLGEQFWNITAGSASVFTVALGTVLGATMAGMIMPSTALAHLYLLTTGKRRRFARELSPRNAVTIQDAMLRDQCSSSVENVWITLDDSELTWGGPPCEVHSLKAHGPSVEAPQLLLVHGTMGSAGTSFGMVLDELVRHFNVTAVDLPGFGVSTAPPALAAASPARTTEWYAHFLRAYLVKMGLEKVGGYPRMIPRILLLMQFLGSR